MEHENMTFVRIHTIIYTHTIASQSNANMTTRRKQRRRKYLSFYKCTEVWWITIHHKFKNSAM
jgi:hypothetical protein